LAIPGTLGTGCWTAGANIAETCAKNIHLVVVEGAIGAGKSFLMGKIKELALEGVITVAEEVERWCEPVEQLNGLSMLGAANEFPDEYGVLF